VTGSRGWGGGETWLHHSSFTAVDEHRFQLSGLDFIPGRKSGLWPPWLKLAELISEEFWLRRILASQKASCRTSQGGC